MRIEFIELCGFRGFRNKIRLDVAPGFAVISGRNGVGKSTLCDAVEFAITGSIDKYRIDKAAKETLSDYVWWRGRGTPEAHYVSIGFCDEAGSRFELTRSREGGANQTPAAIEDALSISGARPERTLQQLCRTSIIRDEWIAALSLDLSETERFDLVRAALGAVERSDYTGKARDVMSSAEAARAAAEQAYEEARSQVNQALVELAETRDIAKRAGDVAAALSAIGNAGDPDADLASRIAEARRTLAERRVRLNAADRLREEIAVLSALRGEIGSAEFEAALESARAEIADAEREASATEITLARAEDQLKVEQQANELAASLAALIEQGEHVGLHDGHCPLCAAARTQTEFQAGLAAARARLVAFGSSAGVARQNLAGARVAMRLAAGRLSEARGVLNGLLAKQDELALQQTALATRLEQLGLSPALATDPAGIEGTVQQERSRLVDLERRILTLEASQAVERITTLEERVTELRDQAEAWANRLAQAQSAVAAAKALNRAVRRTDAEIIDERLAVISPLLSELYQRLRPHAEWRNIEYSIRGDVKRFLSLKVGDNLNPQFVFSSGQRRAAGLAFLLSVHLSRPWCRWQTLILDDPVQHIDDFRALHLVEVLSVLSQAGKQIICAVEDSALAELLSRRLLSTTNASGTRCDLAFSSDGFVTLQRSVRVEPMLRGALSSARPLAAAG